MAKWHDTDDFWKFHNNNLHVFMRFKQLCHDLQRSGVKQIASRRIKDALRELFRLKFRNAFIVLWARLLVQENKSFKPLFKFLKEDIALHHTDRTIGQVQFA